MRADSVYAVFVTFHFGLPNQLSEEIIAAHEDYLNRLPRLNACVPLRNRTEYAYLLVFEKKGDIDAYLESSEFRRFRSSPGCYDVFIKVFEYLASASTEDPIFSVPRHAVDAVEMQSPTIVPV